MYWLLRPYLVRKRIHLSTVVLIVQSHVYQWSQACIVSQARPCIHQCSHLLDQSVSVFSCKCNTWPNITHKHTEQRRVASVEPASGVIPRTWSVSYLLLTARMKSYRGSNLEHSCSLINKMQPSSAPHHCLILKPLELCASKSISSVYFKDVTGCQWKRKHLPRLLIFTYSPSAFKWLLSVGCH